MSEDQPTYEGELVPAAPSPSLPATWQPSPLATMSNADFDRRLELERVARERIARIQKSVMVLDTDYGKIPGTQKPTLFKPGAEILNKMAGYTVVPTYVRFEGDGMTSPTIRYESTCRILDPDGTLVAQGNGASSSWEIKHRYRWADRVCPKCGKDAIIKGQVKFAPKEGGRVKAGFESGGWVCWTRKNGCGTTFIDTDPSILNQADKQENPDPHDLDNTLMKMADKRSTIAATLAAHAASGIFTQDVEDQQEQQPSDSGGPEAPRGGGTSPPVRPDNPNEPISEGQHRLLFAKATHRAAILKLSGDEEPNRILHEVVAGFGYESLKAITVEHYDAIKRTVDEYTG